MFSNDNSYTYGNALGRIQGHGRFNNVNSIIVNSKRIFIPDHLQDKQPEEKEPKYSYLQQAERNIIPLKEVTNNKKKYEYKNLKVNYNLPNSFDTLKNKYYVPPYHKGYISSGMKKNDFIKLECGKQVYTIPAGREINKVMWIEPATTDAAMWANYGGISTSFGGGVMGQMGLSGLAAFGGMGSPYGMGVGVWALPAYDVHLMAADLKNKGDLFHCDLTYKVTAGPDGTHLLHLMNVPGSKFSFGVGQANALSLHNCICWYTYYDVNGNEDECRRDNIGDILLTPDQIPLDKMEYEFLNAPTQNIVRKLLTAKAARALSFIRGKFSGSINMLSASVTMDYGMFSTYADNLESKTYDELKTRFENLSPYKVMENQANLVKNMIEAKKGTPLPIMVI